MAKKPENPFDNYVHHRLASIAMSEEEDRREATKQGVTVRLNPGLVRLLDQLAKNLDQSRQELLVEVIETGARGIAAAYADHCGDKAQEVYRDLIQLTQHQEGDQQ
ncbi:TPA: hypothetical protein NID02_006100 [Pseudomonas aeruginosa]|nr:hypothetical protein [Pseudomonas aeruginosa]